MLVRVLKTFTLTVSNTNDAPLIQVDDTDRALADAFDGSGFSHQLFVTDVDVGDRHIFNIFDEDISWLSLNPETGLLTGTPDDEHVGVYNITFSVEGIAGAASVSNAPLLATVQNVNDPRVH